MRTEQGAQKPFPILVIAEDGLPPIAPACWRLQLEFSTWQAAPGYWSWTRGLRAMREYAPPAQSVSMFGTDMFGTDRFHPEIVGAGARASGPLPALA